MYDVTKPSSTGYLISMVIADPLIGLPLALALHYVLDLITYPSEEMEIKLQDNLSSKRDKVTFFFVTSFLVVLSLVVLLVISKRGMTLYSLMAMLFANLPDIWGQLIPILRRNRKRAHYSHKIQLIRDPYLKIIIHQIFTFVGLVFLLK